VTLNFVGIGNKTQNLDSLAGNVFDGYFTNGIKVPFVLA